VYFLFQLDRGLKEVLVEAKLSAIEGIHGVDGLLGIIADIAEDLTNVRPVFLLNMSVIIFLVGPSPRELNFPFLAVSIEKVVDKLCPIVRVDTQQGEGETPFNFFNGFDNAFFVFSQDGAAFTPSGVNVGDIQGVSE